MDNRYFRKEGLRTVRGRKRKRLSAVLFFFFMLPYLCAVFISKGQESLEKDTSERVVECHGRVGTWQIPMETYIKGALAASIPMECEMETIKAQAVILRTMCEYVYEEREKMDDTAIPASGIGQNYRNQEELKELWGDKYTEYYRKVTQAAGETKGMVLTQDGMVIEPAYFWLSAGKTRDGQEVFGEGKYTYFSGVDCGRDMEAPDFFAVTQVSMHRFLTELQRAAGTEENADWKGKIVLTRDSSGYVTKVSVDGAVISGEAFRELFGLPSSCFKIVQKKESVLIQTRGVGHGLGFDQYAANRLAKEGKDYMELLHIFLKDVEIEKFE